MNSYKEYMSINGMSYDNDEKYSFTENYDLIACKYQGKKNNHAISAVFGKIMGYTLRGRRMRFDGSKETLANQLFMSLSAVKVILELLEKDNLIIDITDPELKSERQTRYYVPNLEEFKKLELIKRVKKVSEKTQKKELDAQEKVSGLFESWGITSPLSDE